MNEDVIGATFMAAATSSPELFINSVGTFITKSDIGVGTVVGSAVFNVLAVPACCGLLTGQVVKLDWWPISRDCFMYAISVISLIVVLSDGVVMWYEGLALALAYFVYISGESRNGQVVLLLVIKRKMMKIILNENQFRSDVLERYDGKEGSYDGSKTAASITSSSIS